MSRALGENSDDKYYIQRKTKLGRNQRVHKVAVRNGPGARCLLLAARLPYIIKAGICICLHSVAS